MNLATEYFFSPGTLFCGSKFFIFVTVVAARHGVKKDIIFKVEGWLADLLDRPTLSLSGIDASL